MHRSESVRSRLPCVALREMESTSRLPLLVRGAVTPKGFIGVTERIFVLIAVALRSAYLCPTIFLRASVTSAKLTPFLL